MKQITKIYPVVHSVLGCIDTFKSESGLTLYRANDVTMMLEYSDYQKAIDTICKHPVKVMLSFPEGEMPATLIYDLDVWRLIMNADKETPEEYSDDELFAIHCAVTYGIALNEHQLRRLTSDDEIERYMAAYELIERMSKEKKSQSGDDCQSRSGIETEVKMNESCKVVFSVPKKMASVGNTNAGLGLGIILIPPSTFQLSSFP